MAIRVLIYLKVCLFAEGIQRLFSGDDDFLVIGSVCDHQQFLHSLEDSPDIVIVDKETFALALETAENMQIRSLLINDKESLEIYYGSLKDKISKGLCGVMPNHSDQELLKKAVKAIFGGDLWLDHSTVHHALVADGGDGNHFKLTKKEKEVLERVCSGLSNKGIAQELLISEQTVKTHCYNLFKKFNVQNRVNLVLAATKDHHCH